MEVEVKLEELSLVVPGPSKTSPGFVLFFSWVPGNHAYVSGHVPLNPDGSVVGFLGQGGGGGIREAGI